MPNTKDLRTDHLNVLAYGSPGTGKTKFIESMATYFEVQGKPAPTIFVFDFDLGLTTIRGANVDYESYPPGDLSGFDKAFTLLLKMASDKNLPYSAICVDSLTSMSTMVLGQLYKANGVTPGIPKEKVNPMQFYQTLKFRLQNFFNVLRGLPITTYVIAHDVMEKDELTGVVSIQPFTDGQSIKGSLPGWFDEYWHFEITSAPRNPTPGGGTYGYVIRTKSTPKVYCRTRLQHLDELEEQDFGRIIAKATR